MIVAFAEECYWHDRAIAALAEYTGQLLVEGPLPPEAADELLGAQVQGAYEQFTGQITPARELGDPDDFLLSHLARMASFAEPAVLSRYWARLPTRELKKTKHPLMSSETWQPVFAYLENAMERIITPNGSYVYPRSVVHAATLLLYSIEILGGEWADALNRSIPTWGYGTSVRLLERVARMLSEREERLEPGELAALLARGEEPALHAGVDLTGLDHTPLEAMEFVAAAVTHAASHSRDDLPLYRELLRSKRPVLPRYTPDQIASFAWSMAGTEQLSSGDNSDVPIPAGHLAALRLWANVAQVDVEIHPPSSAAVPTPATVEDARQLKRLAYVAGPQPSALAERITACSQELLDTLSTRGHEDCHPLTLALTAHAAALVGALPVAQELIAYAAAHMRDPRSGLLMDSAGGVQTGPEVGVSLASVLQLAGRHISGFEGTGDIGFLAEWRRGVGSLQRWSLSGDAADSAETLLHAHPDDAPETNHPLLVRRGNCLGLSFPLISWAVAECSPPPPPPGTRFSRIYPAIGAHRLATGLIESLSLAAGWPRLIVWPWPARMGASLRHDVDRVPPRRTLEPILAGEAKNRQASTYCFIPNRFATPMRSLLEDLGHEIAVHGEQTHEIADDLAAVRGWARTPVVGWTGHGTPTSTSSLGAVTWRAAAEEGALYCDFSGSLSTSFPHPPVAVEVETGVVRVLDLDVFDIDAGIDNYLTKDGEPTIGAQSDFDAIFDDCLSRRDHCCLNNHPDLAGATHAALVSGVVKHVGEQAWWATLAQTSERRRAVTGVDMSIDDGGIVVLRTPLDIAAFQLMLPPRPGTPCLLAADDRPIGRLAAGGEPGLFAFDLTAGSPTRVGWIDERDNVDVPLLSPSRVGARHRPVSANDIARRLDRDGIRTTAETSFPDVRTLLAAAVADQWRDAGVDPETEPAASNIAYNAQRVDARARVVRDFLKAAYGLPVAGQRILDIGCGFGGLGLWLLIAENAASLAAYEKNASHATVLREVVRELGIQSITVEERSYEEMSESADFDLALMIDVFGYDSVALRFDKLASALRPGGVVVIKAANRWSPRDRFSEFHGLHFLSRELGVRTAEFLTGDATAYEKKQLVSPYDLIKALQLAGFVDLRLQGDDDRGGYAVQPYSDFFYLSARTPR